MSELFDEIDDEDTQIVDALKEEDPEPVGDARRRWEKVLEDRRLREDLDDFYDDEP